MTGRFDPLVVFLDEHVHELDAPHVREITMGVLQIRVEHDERRADLAALVPAWAREPGNQLTAVRDVRDTGCGLLEPWLTT